MATRIVEGQLPYTGGTGIEIDANKVIKILLRSDNNLIKVTDENELYTDLQLADGIKPTDEFPVGVTVGKVLASDGWWVSGMLLNMKTTSGDYSRWIYGGDGKLYYDNGTGTFTQIYSSTEVDNLLTQLRNSLAAVAFSGDYNDLINRPQIVQLQADWNQTDVDSPDYIKNKPSIPTKTSELTNDSGFIDSNVNNLANYTLSYLFAAVATSGEYSDLLNAPSVIDNLTSTSAIDSLSANQGRILKGEIDDLKALGKFLSLWDAETGMPLSFPYSTPYNYSTGDYFLVENIGTGTNYRPDGASYSGTASTVVETDEIEVGDIYIYDGAVWLLQANHGKTVSFANLAGSPSDNPALNADLNTRTFFLAGLSGESNLAIAQEAYDWYVAGKYPLISYQRREYILKEVGNVNMQFYSPIDSLIESNNGITKVRGDLLVFTLSSGTVTAINLANRDTNVLATGTNYSTPYTPEYDGSPVTKKYSDYGDEKIISRGENLVTNGFANLGNNYNFEGLDYEGADTYGAGGCFSKTSDNRFLPKTEEFMPIDITKPYRLSYAVKNSADTSTYDCLYMFDIDKNQINTGNTNWTANTTTTLAQELKDGDTVVYLTDTTNWDTSDNQYRRGFIFWNYKNSFGYQYPIETYSRNWWYNLWADSTVAIDKVNNTITLRSAWNHGTFPAGTSLSQSAPSGGLTYGNSNYRTTPGVWTVKEAIFTPDMFRIATSYVKIGWLCNYSAVENATVKFSSVSFTQNALLSDFTNTKVFTLTSSSDLTNAQKAYDEYQAGNNVVINYGGSLYAVNNVTSARMNFYGMKNDIYVNRGQGDSALQSTIMYFVLSSGTVTSIVANNSAYFYTLSTAIDYDTPYTPQYPGSPATKKYVDDKVDDTAYASTWDGETTIAPSKNAVYDKIESVVGSISNATVNFKQDNATKGSITMNQSAGSDVVLETVVPVTQSGYDALPASKTSDGNLYIIYG